MKYISFSTRTGRRQGFGRLEGERVAVLGYDAMDLKAALGRGDLHTLTAWETLAVKDVDLLPVIPNPDKILCIGHNYETHRKETGRDEAAHPNVFTRFADTLVAHDQPLARPKVSEHFDFEGELAVIIGRGGRAIAASDAMNHVAGYACFNDASVRDWQKHNIQFTPGKNFPGTGAFGPFMVTPDDVGDLESQRVITRLNGQVVQDQPISDMIWNVAELIAYLSAFTPLRPGDVIASGTPGGVGARRSPPLWMAPGDMVEVDIGSVGRLQNRISVET